VPEFAGRTCGDCQKYIYGKNGARSENEDTGEPFLRADYGDDNPPPCSTCPKRGPDEPKEPLPEGDDLFAQNWFWEVRELFDECRAVGDFGRPGPFMRWMFTEWNKERERASERRQAFHMTAAVAAVFGRGR
jgi:hypothetical protein